jgi:hypothetical protein
MAVPNLKVHYKEVSGGTIGSFFKAHRRFLVVDNKYFRGYRAFIGARDYGNQLSVTWYLTVKQTWLGKLTFLASKSAAVSIFCFPILIIAKMFQLGKGYVIPEMMDLFDLEELSCYVSTVHAAVKAATEETLKEIDLDFTKADVKSRGFHNLR